MERRRWPARGALVVAASAALVVGCGDDAAERSLQGVQRTPPMDVAGVSLPDAARGNEAFATRARAGGLLVVYFGYTFCPDICPTTLNDVAVALDDLEADARARVDVAMVTVDPERDTGEVLAGYVEHFFDPARAHALRTDDLAVLTAATDAFGVRYEVADHEPGDLGYEVAHTAVTYVIDDDGRVVVEWPFGTEPAAMAADLELLLEEARP